MLIFHKEKNYILNFSPSEEQILMFLLFLSHTHAHAHEHTHTHKALLFHKGADIVPRTCVLQCEVSAIKTEHLNDDSSFKLGVICYSRVVTLVTTTLTAPYNLLRSYVAVSLGSRFRTPPTAWMSGQRNSGTRAEEKSVHARSSLFYPLKHIFPCFTHEIKFTFPQCIINFVLIFFPD